MTNWEEFENKLREFLRQNNVTSITMYDSSECADGCCQDPGGIRFTFNGDVNDYVYMQDWQLEDLIDDE